MTVIDTPRVLPEGTPESHNLESLRAMLDDPGLAGFHDEIREAIVRLTATSMLEA